MPILPVAGAVGLLASGALFDRLIGWGGFGRTKPSILAALSFALFAAALGLVTAPGLAIAGVTLPVWAAPLAFGLSFLAWRDVLPWALFGSRHGIDPRNTGELLSLFVRHLTSLVFLIPALLMGKALLPVAGFLVLFSLLATALGALNGHEYGKRVDINDKVEAGRGLLLSACLILGFLL